MPVISHQARIRPESTAIECRRVTLTYGELHRQVGAWAQVLSRLPYQSIGLCLHDPLETIILLFAGMRAGMAVHPLSTRLPKQALAAAAQRVGLGAVVTRHRHDVAHYGVTPESLSEWTQTIGSDGGNPSLIVDTSGSTGIPKAAVLGARSLEVSAKWANERLELNANSRYLLSLPLDHVSGLSIPWRTFLAGGTVVLQPRGWTMEDMLVRKKVTHASMVATQLRRLLRQREGEAPECLGAVLVGGDVVLPSLLLKAYRRGYPVRTTYGLTEMTSQVTTLARWDVPEKLSTSGTLLPGRQLCIGELNQILVRGDVLFRGYLRGGRLTLPVDTHGWFYTGDAGTMDSEGYLSVTGRLDNMFVSGGENIWPEEIERILIERYGLDQAVVVPVADPEYGCRPAGFITRPREGKPLRRITEEMEEWLPRFKIPRLIPWEGTRKSMKPDRQMLARRAARELVDG